MDLSKCQRDASTSSRGMQNHILVFPDLVFASMLWLYYTAVCSINVIYDREIMKLLPWLKVGQKVAYLKLTAWLGRACSLVLIKFRLTHTQSYISASECVEIWRTGVCTAVSDIKKKSLQVTVFQSLLITCSRLQRYTYSSFPRKDVSLHATFLVGTPEELLTDEEDFFRCWSSNSFQPLWAVTGLRIWSELIDVRSVLMSNDVQEESDEPDGLVSTFSSSNLSRMSMMQEGKWENGIMEDKKEKDEDEWQRKNDKDLDEAECIGGCLDGTKALNGWKKGREGENSPKLDEWMQSDVSGHLHWPKAFYSFSLVSAKYWGVRREMKDKRPITGRIREKRWWYGCQGRKRKPLRDSKRSETCRMEGLNTNKRCGGIRWKVRAAALTKWYLTSHYIPFPPHSMIESCGKWKETARHGKSIWDAWRSLNQWLLWLHDSRRQESAVLGCTDKRFITRSLTHSKYNKGSPLKPIRALVWGGQVSQPPIGALETHLCRQHRSTMKKLCTHSSVCLYIKMYIHWLRGVRPATCLGQGRTSCLSLVGLLVETPRKIDL